MMGYRMLLPITLESNVGFPRPRMQVARQLALQESVQAQQTTFPQELPQSLNQTVCRLGPEIEYRSKGSTMKDPEHGFSPATPIAQVLQKEWNGNLAHPRKRNQRGGLAVS